MGPQDEQIACALGRGPDLRELPTPTVDPLHAGSVEPFTQPDKQLQPQTASATAGVGGVADHPAGGQAVEPADELGAALGVAWIQHDADGRASRHRHCRRTARRRYGRPPRPGPWDGADEAGRALESGVYFARLVVDGQAAGVRRLVIRR